MALEPIKPELFKKAGQLGASSAAADIEVIKQVVIERTRIGVRVVGYKNGVVKLAAENSAASAELFLHRAQLLEAINQRLGQPAVKQITIVPAGR